jgi:hypothetical protein
LAKTNDPQEINARFIGTSLTEWIGDCRLKLAAVFREEGVPSTRGPSDLCQLDSRTALFAAYALESLDEVQHELWYGSAEGAVKAAFIVLANWSLMRSEQVAQKKRNAEQGLRKGPMKAWGTPDRRREAIKEWTGLYGQLKDNGRQLSVAERARSIKKHSKFKNLATGKAFSTRQIIEEMQAAKVAPKTKKTRRPARTL